MMSSVTVTPLSNTTMTTVNVTSADIFVTGCFSNFETVSCVRSATLTLLAVLTCVLCILKLIKFHHAHHPDWHQYFIFYCASLECAIAGVHFVLTNYVQFDFVLQWLKLTQFLVMCHFYWTLAMRALRREVWATRFLIPFLAAACAYFTVIAILGIVNVKSSFTECFQPYWLELSAAEFTIVQLFCVAGFYITRRLNEISTLDSVRRSQKRDLWCIVIVFEVSAFVGFLYDLSVRIIGDENNGCNDVFNYSQTVFSVIFFIFMVMKLLLPIWVMLYVFQPAPQAVVDTDDLIPALTDDGTSAFSPTIDEQYRQLYHPTEDYRGYGSDSSPNSPYSYEGIANGFKRPNSQTNLDPIKEELSTKAAKQNTPIGVKENNNSEQCQPQVEKNQNVVISSVPNRNSLPTNSILEPVLQGQGQQGSNVDQRSPQTQGQEEQKDTDQQLPISQSQGQQDSDRGQKSHLSENLRQPEPDLGQRSLNDPSGSDNLQDLLSHVPVLERSYKGHPAHSNQEQHDSLPQVQIQQGANIREPSPPRKGGHVRTNVQVAPKFSIQSSEEGDEESPPSPKGKFYI